MKKQNFSFMNIVWFALLIFSLLILNACQKNSFSSETESEGVFESEQVTEYEEVTQPEVTESEVTEPETTEPKVTEPEVTEPEVTEPEVTEPEITEPEITEPEITEPEETEPEVTEPEKTEPEVTEPEVTEPKVTEPEITEPEVTEPEVTEPEVTEPEETEPEVTEPEVTEPEETEPEVTEPEVTEPEETEPEVTEPEVTEPEETEPEVTEPEVTEPEVTEPEETEPEVTEPEVTEPEVTEPEVTEPEETEPEVTEPEVTEPEETEPEVTEPEETEPEVTEPTEFTLDFSQYVIVQENLSASSISNISKKLQEHFSTVGIDLSIHKDSSTYDDSSKEILLGNTSRPETAALLAELPENQGYGIKFHENKIVIAARNAYFLSEAVDAFAALYFDALSDKKLTVAADEFQTGAPCAIVFLSENGKPIARIIRDFQAHQSINEVALSLSDRLTSLSDVSYSLLDQYEYSPDALDIVLGVTPNYTQSENFRNTLALNEYGFCVDGTKIVLTGHTMEASVLSTTLFIKYLQYAIYDENTDSLSICLPLRHIQTEAKQFGDFPRYDGGTYQGAIECGNQTVQMLYKKIDPATIDAYIEELINYGFSKVQENNNKEQTGNRFVTLMKENGLLHLAYYSYNKSFTVLSDPLTVNSYYTDGYEGTNVFENNTLSVMTLDYSKHAPVNNCDPRLNAGGLSYIITLKDGRFIVIDGGYNSKNGTQDCDILYEYMSDHTLLTDENGNPQIVIAAWIFTHDSPDHHEAFESFVPKYCKNDSIVTIQNLIYNNGVESQYSDGYRKGLYTNAPAFVNRYFPDCKIIQPHTGQKFTIGEIEVEFLYTLESLYPTLATDANDASMIFRMNIDGMTVLFTGDAIANPCNLTAKIYKEYLKTDMMQINHHGTTGLTTQLYQYVDPLYTLWPTSETCFEARTAGETYPTGFPNAITAALNVRIINDLNEKHETTDVSIHSWYADGPIEIMTFSEDKTISIETYTLDPSLTPELPPFVPES